MPQRSFRFVSSHTQKKKSFSDTQVTYRKKSVTTKKLKKPMANLFSSASSSGRNTRHCLTQSLLMLFTTLSPSTHLYGAAIWTPEQVLVAYGGRNDNSTGTTTVSMHVQWVITSDTEATNGLPFTPYDSLVEYWEDNGKLTMMRNNGTRFGMALEAEDKKSHHHDDEEPGSRSALAEDHHWTPAPHHHHSTPDPTADPRNWTFHKNIITGLKPGTRYNYHVGNDVDGWSNIYTFTTVDPTKHEQSYFIYGDLGTSQDHVIGLLTEDMIKSQGTTQSLTATFHIGDMAYDLNNDEGRRGDVFMNSIEPVSAYLPYMTCLGNHEKNHDYFQYTHRFNNMPANAPNFSDFMKLTSSGEEWTMAGDFPREYKDLQNNWFYSYEINNTHFVMLNVEAYVNHEGKKYEPVVQAQYEWLERDLASVDRSKIDFIIIMGHKGFYCSTVKGGSVCAKSFGNAIRFGISVDEEVDPLTGIKTHDGATTKKYGLEALFLTYKVDFYFAGHEHNYERMGAIANNTEVTPWEADGHTIRNPTAPVFIITGAPGNREPLYPFDSEGILPFSKYRANIFSYGKLIIYNQTHIYFEQVGSDPTDEKTYRKAMDYMWLIKDKNTSQSHIIGNVGL